MAKRPGRAMIVAGLFCGMVQAQPSPGTASDQTAPTLNGVAVPVTLTGRWDFEGKRSNTWSLRVDKLHPDGKLEGNVTWWGVRCNVKGEAITEGSWRDGKLRIRAPTDNRFVCEDLLIDLAPGTSNLFEGTSTTSLPNATVRAWLERPK